MYLYWSSCEDEDAFLAAGWISHGLLSVLEWVAVVISDNCGGKLLYDAEPHGWRQGLAL